MLRLTKWLPFVLMFVLTVVVGKHATISSEGKGVSDRVAKALAKWSRLQAEKITLLPLTPTPRPPAIGKIIRGESPFLCVGPVKALVRGRRIYVVDDMDNRLVECSINGNLLRELKFPPNIPKSMSGDLNFCGNLLWVGFETAPYAFAVDINSWQIVEERRWENKRKRKSKGSFDKYGVVKALFATSDKTLYAVMPGELYHEEYEAVSLWRLVKINPQGDQQEQMVRGWYPCYVDSDETVYWISHGMGKFLSLGYGKFGDRINIFAEIKAEDLGAEFVHHSYETTIIGIHDEKIICEIQADIPISEQSEFITVSPFLIVSKSGQVKPIGLAPSVPMSARYWCLPRYSMDNGKIYFIAREDIGEKSRFWLIRLKIQF